MKRKIILLDSVLILLLILVVFAYKNKDQLKGFLVENGLVVEQAEDVLEDDEQDVDELTGKEEAEVIPEEEIEEPFSPTTILFTGDVEISDYVQPNYDAKGVDGVVSEDLAQKMREASVCFVNNEFCYSTRGEKAPDKQFTFRVDPSYVSLLTDLGVDVAGLANNHVLDYGRDALTDTFATLTDAGIEYTGAGASIGDANKLVIKEHNGKMYGFLAASHVIPVASWDIKNGAPGVFTCYDHTDLLNSIKAAKETCDYVFVCVHWGVERTTELESYQVNMGHDFIEAGADAVIGAHSHCLQPVEFYQGKPIFYSLGNFIFNQNIPATAAVEFEYDENENMSIKLYPATASGAKTSLVSGDEATKIYDYIVSISNGISISEDGVLTTIQ